MITKYNLKGKSKDSYMECLVKFLPLRSIKNDEQLADAASVIDELILWTEVLARMSIWTL